MIDKLPIKIDPCPIVEAIVEIRFKSNIPGQAVFGMLYEKLRDEFPKFEKLSILDLPDQLIEMDPNLKFKPHFRLLQDDGFLLQIGPRSISFVNVNNYFGWSNFTERIYTVIRKILPLNIIDEFIRLGIRYINLFNIDIFSKLQSNLCDSGSPLYSKNMRFYTSLKDGDFTSHIRVNNKGSVQVLNTAHEGSIIDIDTFIEFSETTFSEELYIRLLEEGHEKEKTVFFNMFDGDYLKELNPIYEESK